MDNTINTLDHANQNETDRLVEKSRKLRERSKATNENLDKLKVNSDDLRSEIDNDRQPSSK